MDSILQMTKTNDNMRNQGISPYLLLHRNSNRVQFGDSTTLEHHCMELIHSLLKVF